MFRAKVLVQMELCWKPTGPMAQLRLQEVVNPMIEIIRNQGVSIRSRRLWSRRNSANKKKKMSWKQRSGLEWSFTK